MDEEWVQVKDFPDYEVSFDGLVRNIDNGNVLTPTRAQTGLLMVGLVLNKTQYKRALDLIVAEAYLEKHPMEAFNASVIHLDGDLENCNAANLMWRPRWFKTAFMKQFKKSGPTIKHPIYCVDTGEIFENSRAVSMAHGVLDIDVVMSVSNGPEVWPHGYSYELHRE